MNQKLAFIYHKVTFRCWSLLILAFISTSPFNSTVQAANRCELVFLEAFPPKNILSYNREYKSRDESTVKILSSIAGKHGGKKILLEAENGNWYSTFKLHQNDFQGDPRYFIDMIGAKEAKFFGFETIGNNRMTIPDAKEFSAALAKVNLALERNGHEPVAIKFFEATADQDLSLKSYLTHFKEKIEIPLSSSGNEMIHDFSYHTSVVLMPNRYLRTMVNEINKFENAMEALQEKYSKAPNDVRKAVSTYIRFFRYCKVRSIDEVTGFLPENISIGVRSAQRNQNGSREFDADDFSGILSVPINYIVSPYGYAQMRNAFLQNIKSGLAKGFGFGLPPEVLVSANQKLPITEIYEFLKPYESTDWDGFINSGNPEISGRTLAREIVARRTQIIHAIRSIY